MGSRGPTRSGPIRDRSGIDHPSIAGPRWQLGTFLVARYQQATLSSNETIETRTRCTLGQACASRIGESFSRCYESVSRVTIATVVRFGIPVAIARTPTGTRCRNPTPVRRRPICSGPQLTQPPGRLLKEATHLVIIGRARARRHRTRSVHNARQESRPQGRFHGGVCIAVEPAAPPRSPVEQFHRIFAQILKLIRDIALAHRHARLG